MSHKIIRISIIAAIIGILSACSSLNSGLRWLGLSSQLNDAELNEMISSGTRMSLNWANGETGAITYHANGTAAAETEGKSTRGTWKIKDKKLCLNWTPNDAQSEQCYTIHRNKEGGLKLYDENGSLSAEATIPGLSS